MDVPSPGRWKLLAQALRRRCAYCGGRVFSGWYKLDERCAQCGLRSDRVVGHWIGAVGMNTIVSFGAMAVTLVVGIIATYPDVSLAPLLVPPLVAAVAVPLVFWPFSQTLWTALDIMMRPVTRDELDPRYLGE
ncbi:MAG: DUF983 domain-containing protein [Acidimicrobiia bacterium]|nr:DUF983 domain-containing protein [Acidimicrobiia bacterium]